jgi:hypothetical protein
MVLTLYSQLIFQSTKRKKKNEVTTGHQGIRPLRPFSAFKVTTYLLHRQAVHRLRLQVRRVLIRTRGLPAIVVAFAVILGRRKVGEVLNVTWSVGVGAEIVVKVALARVAVREHVVERIRPVGRALATAIGTKATHLIEDAAEAGRKIVRSIIVKIRPSLI